MKRTMTRNLAWTVLFFIAGLSTLEISVRTEDSLPGQAVGGWVYLGCSPNRDTCRVRAGRAGYRLSRTEARASCGTQLACFGL